MTIQELILTIFLMFIWFKFVIFVLRKVSKLFGDNEEFEEILNEMDDLIEDSEDFIEDILDLSDEIIIGIEDLNNQCLKVIDNRLCKTKTKNGNDYCWRHTK